MNQARMIEILEQKITQLINEYNQYFQGAIKLEPVTARRDVERIIRQLKATAITNTSARFRFNNQVARFNSYRQLWNRQIQKLEQEGLSPVMREKLKKEKSSDGQETL